MEYISTTALGGMLHSVWYLALIRSRFSNFPSELGVGCRRTRPPTCTRQSRSGAEGQVGLKDFFAWTRQNFDPRVIWSDIEWVRTHWKRPLILKGIVDPSDAREEVRLGIDGIVVPNHGGRQLDGALSSARALPLIAEAVGDQLTVQVHQSADFAAAAGAKELGIRGRRGAAAPVSR
jgi:FMN-dependent dehydrogenase